MGRKYILDIEADSKDPRAITKIHCVALCDLETGRTCLFGDPTLGADRPMDMLDATLDKADAIIGHNIIGYDLPAMAHLLGYEWSLSTEPGKPDTFRGKQVYLYDTLVMSKTNKPERRPAGHSLKAWGKRLKCPKDDYQGGWDTANEEMYTYCRQDTVTNRVLYNHLLDEIAPHDYTNAWWLEQRTFDIVVNDASRRGFRVDTALGEKAYKEFIDEMALIEKRLIPQLDMMPHNIGTAKAATPPKTQLLKNGSISAVMLRWLDRHEIPVVEQPGPGKKAVVMIYNKRYDLPLRSEPVTRGRQPSLSASNHICAQMMRGGWVPTEWEFKDLKWHDKDKRVKTYTEYQVSVRKYIGELRLYPWIDKVAKALRVPSGAIEQKLLQSYKERKVLVIKGPSIYMKVGDDKRICPNLLRLGDKYGWVADYIKYNTLKHRRSILRGSKPGKGWLENERVLREGVISTVADTCGANTFRFTHRGVCNIPKVSVLGGEYLRGALCCDEDEYLVGCDAAGQEARVEAHWTWGYDDDTKEYSSSLIREKANVYRPGVELDVHQTFAKQMTGCTDEFLFTEEGGKARSAAKGLKYGISYGAGVSKVAAIVGKDESEGQSLMDTFWAVAWPLAKLKESVISEFEDKGSIGMLDGRRAFPRSPHSAVNLLFQGSGALITKYACIWWYDKVKAEGLEAGIRIIYHDEFQVSTKKGQQEFYYFDTKEEANTFLQDNYDKIYSDIQKIDGKYRLVYDRAGELQVLAWRAAGIFFKTNVPFTGGYVLGNNWAETH